MAQKRKSARGRPASHSRPAPQQRTPSRPVTEPAAPPASAAARGASAWVARLDADARWLAGTLATAVVLLALTFSGNATFGDSPESVVGIQSWGVLHAPGYPSYVFAARVFTALLPLGDITLEVNLFSATCALVAIGFAFRLARQMGASNAGAAFAALALATGTSFWFYAGFAKHYAFSTMLVALSWWAMVRWHDTKRLAPLVTSAVAVGALVGASWQLAALGAPALLLLLMFDERNWVRSLFVYAGVAAAVAVLSIGIMYARSASDPAIDLGDVADHGSLVDHFFLRDFGYGASAFTSGETAAGNREVGGSNVGRLPQTLVKYALVLSRELNVALLVLAAIGLWTATRTDRKGWLLVVAFATNILGAAMVVAPWRVLGFGTVLRQGGFLAAAFLAAAVAAGIGITALVSGAIPRRRRRGVPRRRVGTFGPALPARRRPAAIVAAALLVVLLPALLVHRREAEHKGPDHVAAYARDVLDLLPRDAVLITRGLEIGMPLVYRQEVFGERRDVDVVFGDGSGLEWYRRQLRDRAGLRMRWRGSPDTSTAAFAQTVARDRPVFLDMPATDWLTGKVAYRVRGVVSEVLPDGTQPVQPEDLDEVTARAASYDRRILREERRNEFPLALVMRAYRILHFELGRLADARGDAGEARRQLQAVLRLDPGNELARDNLATFDD